jgi:hypothetical protein
LDRISKEATLPLKITIAEQNQKIEYLIAVEEENKGLKKSLKFWNVAGPIMIGLTTGTLTFIIFDNMEKIAALFKSGGT